MELYIGIILYVCVIFGIGLYTIRKRVSMGAFMLANRGFSPLTAALNVAASDMSGWLMLALPGLIYASGLSGISLPIALILGAFSTWIIVAKRLRIYSEKLDANTVIDFLQKRLLDKGFVFTRVAGMITLIFFLPYLVSSLIMFGLSVSSIFNISYTTAILWALVLVPLYLMLSGLSTLSVVDVFQALLMFFALVLVGVLAFVHFPESSVGLRYDPIDFSQVASHLGWSLGYLGQLHVLVRFMAIKHAHKVHLARNYHMSWMILSLGFACLTGYLGFTFFPYLNNPEMIFIVLSRYLIVKAVAGVCFAAVLAAIVSSISAQVMKMVSTLSSDLLKLKSVNATRVLIILCMAVSSVIALYQPLSIMDLVAFAWCGIGSAFGPCMIMSLYYKKTSNHGCCIGMIASSLLVIVAMLLGVSSTINAWAFILNLSIILVVSNIWPASHAVQNQFDRLKA